jgi:acyl carrier protein
VNANRATHILAVTAGAVAAEMGLSLAAIDLDAIFIEVGLDSAGLVAVAGQLSDDLGAEIPPEMLFDYPTPRLLAEHLAASGA